MHRSLKVQPKGLDHADQSFIHPTTGNPRQVNHNTKIKNKEEYSKKFFQRRLALQMQVRQQILKKMKSKTPIKKNKIETQKKMKKKCEKQISISQLQKEKVQKDAKYIGLSAEKYQDNYHKFNFNEKMEKNRKEDSTTKYTKQALKYDKDYKLDLGQLIDKNKAQSKFCKLLTISNRPQIQFQDRPYLNFKARPQIASKQLYEKKRKQEQYEQKSEYMDELQKNMDYFGNKKLKYINPQHEYYEKQSSISIQFNNSKLNENQRQNGKIKINNKESKNVQTTPIIYKLGYSGLTNQKSQQQKAKSNGFKCEIDESLRARLADMIMQQRQKYRTSKKQLSITPISSDTPISNKLAKNTGIIYNYRQNNPIRYNQMLSQSLYSNSAQSSIGSGHLSRQLHRKHRSRYNEDEQYGYECQQRKSRRLQQYLYDDQISIPMMSRKFSDNRAHGFIFSSKFRNNNEDIVELFNHENNRSPQNQFKNHGQSSVQQQNMIKHEKQTDVREKKMYITPANQNQHKKQNIIQQNRSEIQSEHSQIICAICQTNILYKLWPYATFYNKNSQQPQYYNFYEIFHDLPPQNEEHNPSEIPILLHCGHPYHKLCIEEWFKYKTVCPLCKTEHEGGQENSEYYPNEMSHQLTFISDSGDDQNEDFVYFHQNRHNHYINHIQQEHEVIELEEIDVNNLINSRLSISSNNARQNNFMVSFNNYVGQSSNSNSNYRGIGYNRAINRQLTNLQIQSSIQISQSGWDVEIDRPIRRNIGSINRNILRRQRERQSQSQVDHSQIFKLAQSECESNSNDQDQKLQISSFIEEGQSLQSCALYSEQDN